MTYWQSVDGPFPVRPMGKKAGKERVFRFRAVEKRIAASRPGFRVLDVGCGRGENLRRLVRYGGQALGIEPNLERAREAQSIAPAAVGVGEHLPLAGGGFEMVYISHVLHHARDLPRAFRPLEIFTPLFIGVEALLHRLLGRRWGGHCYLVSRKPGPGIFPDEGLGPDP